MSRPGAPPPGSGPGCALLSAVGWALRDAPWPVAVVVLDRELRFVAVSAGAAAISGVAAAAQHVGRRWQDVWPSGAAAMEAGARRDDLVLVALRVLRETP